MGPHPPDIENMSVENPIALLLSLVPHTCASSPQFVYNMQPKI